MLQFFRYIIEMCENFSRYDNYKILFRSIIRAQEEHTYSLEYLYYIS